MVVTQVFIETVYIYVEVKLFSDVASLVDIHYVHHYILFCEFSGALQTRYPALIHLTHSLELLYAEAMLYITRENITWLTSQVILMTEQARLAVTGRRHPCRHMLVCQVQLMHPAHAVPKKGPK